MLYNFVLLAERYFTSKQQSKISGLQKELIKYEKENFDLKREVEVLHSRLCSVETHFREFNNIYSGETYTTLDNFDLNTTLSKYKQINEDNKMLAEKLKNIESTLQIKNNEFLEQKIFFDATLSSLKYELNQSKDEVKKTKSSLHEAASKEERTNAELTDVKILLQKSQDLLETMKWDSQSSQTSKNDDFFLPGNKNLSIDNRSKSTKIITASEVDENKNNNMESTKLIDMSEGFKQEDTKSIFQFSCMNSYNIYKDNQISTAPMANECQWATSEPKDEDVFPMIEYQNPINLRMVSEIPIEIAKSSVVFADANKTPDVEVNQDIGKSAGDLEKVRDESLAFKPVKKNENMEEYSVRNPAADMERANIAKIETNSILNDASRGELAAEATSKLELEIQAIGSSKEVERNTVRNHASENVAHKECKINNILDEKIKSAENSDPLENDHAVVEVQAVEKTAEPRDSIQVEETQAVDDLAKSNMEKIEISCKELQCASSEEVKETKTDEEKTLATIELDSKQQDYEGENEERNLALQAKGEGLVYEDTDVDTYTDIKMMNAEVSEKAKGRSLVSEDLSKIYDEITVSGSTVQDMPFGPVFTEKSNKNKIMEIPPEKCCPVVKKSSDIQTPVPAQNKNHARQSPSESDKINAGKIIHRAILNKMKNRSVLRSEGTHDKGEAGTAMFEIS